jgi:hypothetical protein
MESQYVLNPASLNALMTDFSLKVNVFDNDAGLRVSNVGTEVRVSEVTDKKSVKLIKLVCLLSRGLVIL